jgi:hypothetical protein
MGSSPKFHETRDTLRYGEQGPSPYLLPLSVDGLIIVASVSLVELAGRIRATEATTTPAPASSLNDVPSHPNTAQLRDPSTHAWSAAALDVPDPAAAERDLASAPYSAVQMVPAAPEQRHPRRSATPADPAAPRPQRRTAEAGRSAATSDTAAAVAYWHDSQPHLRPSDIAERIGRSERHVRRVLATLQAADPSIRSAAESVPIGVNSAR